MKTPWLDKHLKAICIGGIIIAALLVAAGKLLDWIVP